MKTGSLTFVKIGDKVAIGETSSSINSDSNAIDVSSKLSGRDTNVEYGRMNRTISVSCIGDTTPNDTYFGLDDALEAQENKTKVVVVRTSFTDKTATTEVAGDRVLTGTGIITNASEDSGDDAAVTFSMSIQIDGGFTRGINA